MTSPISPFLQKKFFEYVDENIRSSKPTRFQLTGVDSNFYVALHKIISERGEIYFLEHTYPPRKSVCLVCAAELINFINKSVDTGDEITIFSADGSLMIAPNCPEETGKPEILMAATRKMTEVLEFIHSRFGGIIYE